MGLEFFRPLFSVPGTVLIDASTPTTTALFHVPVWGDIFSFTAVVFSDTR